ncbi:MAG TPA: DUF4010 domain-containing protein [Edaphobacter sp.]|jgi:uncharacterized membrane protein (DUF4010 family)|nr:DUF4010 domain-containing protein [Edaphobacter sp.]
MNSWLDQLHGGSTAFPPAITAIKLAVALAIGLLIGFERQWSHKDFGVRTFSLTALLGALTAIISAPVMLMGMLATILLAVLLNVRDIVASSSVEGTTSVALVVTFVLGALIGDGHMFTSVACAIVATWLLSLKPQFKQFAGGVRAEEIRSAVLLGLFGFVIWPLLPDRYVDPWRLLEPREAWVTVVIVAGIGFANYVLLRVYGKRGVALTAILGGLVNSTSAAAELATVLPVAGLLSQTVPAVLLTSVAMFLRNAVLLGLFGRSAVRFAVLPLLAMMIVAAYFAFRHQQVDANPKELELHLASPVSLKRVISFGFLFVTIQIVGTLAVRWLGNSGVLLVSVIGGTVSSASTTAAAANLLTHGNVSAQQAGTATVLTSIASTTMNLPILKRQIKVKGVMRKITLATVLQGIVGITILFFERWFVR